MLELAIVALAAAIALFTLDSTYAAAVAGLTTGAVVIALDSLFAVRSPRDGRAGNPASVTPLRAARDRQLSRP